jgi:lysophospholipase L1-like esterase
VRFVAIGDSFTEGIGDERADGTPRGWADLTAAGLAADRTTSPAAGAPGEGSASAAEPVEYANLAIRGRLLAPIVTDQLPAALALRPSLVTLNGGGIDIMRPGAEVAALVGLVERAVLSCAAAGVRLVVLSGADPSQHLPLGRVIRRQGQVLSDQIASLCAAHAVTYADNWSDDELRRAAYWSADRLHLNPAGHRRVAARLLTVLGAAAPEKWLQPLDDPDRARGLGENLRFYREHVLPWVQRRVRGRSSGDGRAPKYAEWQPAPVEEGWPAV